MRKAMLVALAHLVVSLSIAAQIPSARVVKEEDKVRRRWWMSMSLASVFDTNITHDERQVSAFGLVPSFGLHFRDNPERPSLEVDYEVALHRYNNTDEFDRVSHNLSAIYRKQLLKRLYAKTTTEISFKAISAHRPGLKRDRLVRRREARAALSRRPPGRVLLSLRLQSRVGSAQ